MIDHLMTDSRILIVDDQEDNVYLLERLLTRKGYTNLHRVLDPREFFAALAAFAPDLILLDLQMPHLDGFTILERLAAAQPDDSYLPVLVLTANITPEAKNRALSLGAKDFLHKPFDATETLLRIGNLLRTRHLHLRLLEHNQNLEAMVRVRTGEVEEAKLEILRHLARAAEFRDDATGDHQQRVGRMAEVIARRMGMSETGVKAMAQAALLHDVGKIAMPDAVLLKPGKLTEAEFATMKGHTTAGSAILAGSRNPILVLAAEIALNHHECWNGSGYPAGLAGKAIPLSGRIVAVADVYDALTHIRPYKPAWAAVQALEEIRQGAGTKFDPAVVAAFLEAVRAGELAPDVPAELVAV